MKHLNYKMFNAGEARVRRVENDEVGRIHTMKDISPMLECLTTAMRKNASGEKNQKD